MQSTQINKKRRQKRSDRGLSTSAWPFKDCQLPPSWILYDAHRPRLIKVEIFCHYSSISLVLVASCVRITFSVFFYFCCSFLTIRLELKATTVRFGPSGLCARRAEGTRHYRLFSPHISNILVHFVLNECVIRSRTFVTHFTCISKFSIGHCWQYCVLIYVNSRYFSIISRYIYCYGAS